MKKFMRIVRHCRVEYPLLWSTGSRNRRIMVYYWIPDVLFPLKFKHL